MSMHAAAWCLSSPCLTGSLHITPDEVMTTSEERSQRPGLGVEGPEHRLGEGVADDGDGVDALALDGVEQLGHVEVAALER